MFFILLTIEIILMIVGGMLLAHHGIVLGLIFLIFGVVALIVTAYEYHARKTGRRLECVDDCGSDCGGVWIFPVDCDGPHYSDCGTPDCDGGHDCDCSPDCNL